VVIGSVTYLLKGRGSPANIPYDVGSIAAQVEELRNAMGNTSDTMGEVCNTILDMNASLPGAILRSIQGSISPRKGKVGELVTLLKLTSEYDRIIPLGQPVDMIGIGKNSIDFIEIKTGSSQLTHMEKHTRNLVREGKVRFVTVQHDINIAPALNTDIPVREEVSDSE
jgi:hypothetical protein